MKIAIIILNYNSSPDCRKCIEFLKYQEGVELEIIVVDNCSSREGEQEAIRQLCQQQGCTFIQAKTNKGYNAGNNIGLRYATEKGYEYAMIANPDMEFPEKEYVRTIVEVMTKDKQVVVCGSDILTPEGKHQNPMKRDGNWLSSFSWIKGIFKTDEDACYLNSCRHQTHYCDKVSGCCLLLRLNYIDKIGYFDEHIFLYCEEAILSRQVERDGMKMLYVAETQALHRHIASEKGNTGARFKAWVASRIYFEKKYNDEGFFKNAIKTMNWKLYEYVFRLKNTITTGKWI